MEKKKMNGAGKQKTLPPALKNNRKQEKEK